tara:strand:+ start:530 stop:700 length:171 start_codon:yes stop_codon:yes gene_type:complete
VETYPEVVGIYREVGTCPGVVAAGTCCPGVVEIYREAVVKAVGTCPGVFLGIREFQ